VGQAPTELSVQAADLAHVAAWVAIVATLWIIAVQVPVILVHVQDPLRARWTALADPMQAVRHATIHASVLVAVSTDIAETGLRFVILETGTLALMICAPHTD
jgi:hypothetical protein